MGPLWNLNHFKLKFSSKVSLTLISLQSNLGPLPDFIWEPHPYSLGIYLSTLGVVSDFKREPTHIVLDSIYHEMKTFLLRGRKSRENRKEIVSLKDKIGRPLKEKKEGIRHHYLLWQLRHVLVNLWGRSYFTKRWSVL